MDNINNFILANQKSGELKEKDASDTNITEQVKKDLPLKNDQEISEENQVYKKGKEITMETILSHFTKNN